MTEEFGVGDIVRHRAGGIAPDMVVIEARDKRIFCQWFGRDSNVHSNWFRPEALRLTNKYGAEAKAPVGPAPAPSMQRRLVGTLREGDRVRVKSPAWANGRVGEITAIGCDNSPNYYSVRLTDIQDDCKILACLPDEVELVDQEQGLMP